MLVLRLQLVAAGYSSTTHLAVVVMVVVVLRWRGQRERPCGRCRLMAAAATAAATVAHACWWGRASYP